MAVHHEKKMVEQSKQEKGSWEEQKVHVAEERINLDWV